jgi:hypothetical protein
MRCGPCVEVVVNCAYVCLVALTTAYTEVIGAIGDL